MPKPRGREHTSLTETATIVVQELKKIPGIKMIAPGEIKTNRRSSGGKFITCNYTNAGFELLISGQSTQKISVHTYVDAVTVFSSLKQTKKLTGFHFKERVKKPGI